MSPTPSLRPDPSRADTTKTCQNGQNRQDWQPVVKRVWGLGVMEIAFRLVTWGLLCLFAGFLTYGAAMASYTLVRFYRQEFAKLNRARHSKALS